MTYGINGSCLLKAIRAVLNDQTEHGFWYLKKKTGINLQKQKHASENDS